MKSIMTTFKVYVPKKALPYIEKDRIIDGMVTITIDEEDEPVVKKYKWTLNTYGKVKTKINGVETFLQQVIMNSYTIDQIKKMNWLFYLDSQKELLNCKDFFWMLTGDKFDYTKKNIGWSAPL